MNKKSYYARLALYIAIAALPVISSGLSSGHVKGVSLAIMLIDTVLAGLVAARAFIDRSPSEFHDTEKENENG